MAKLIENRVGLLTKINHFVPSSKPADQNSELVLQKGKEKLEIAGQNKTLEEVLLF
ncbi:hypothetical protein [Algoriphagus lacus]|uniref:hypothetical protein n=1 Tax=Algoriphagus lacus TaxID=2056311 RepID=UPI001314E7CF|nr:hypothetical protein [Algoriphagus lacus]